MKLIYFIILFLLFNTFELISQDEQPLFDSPLIDSVSTDSLVVNDSTAIFENANKRIPDSLLSVPLTNHGKLFQSKYEPFRKINKRDIQLINYTGLNDILSAFTPFYNQHLGSYATYNSFLALGANSRSISWAFNGRNINDLDLGSLNPEQFPDEFFENIEIWTGADAVIFGDNASSVFVNIQEIKYNTGSPFTRVWFGNSGYGYLGADGIYSQNFRPNWNFTFGFRSFYATGAYPNNWASNWNTRFILRWNPDNQTSISLSENFSNLGSGISGGVNTEMSEDVYDIITAIPNFDRLKERLFRHDLTLSTTRNFDTLNTNTATVNLYFSSILKNRSSGTDLQFNEADTSGLVHENTYSYVGAEGRYEVDPFDALSLRFGGSAEYDMMDRTFLYEDFNGLSTAAYAHSTIRFSDDFDLSGGVRLYSKFGNVGIAYGVKQRTQLSKDFSFVADASYSDRLPFPIEGLNLNSEQQIAIHGEIIYKLSETSQVLAGAYLRSIFSPIMSEINQNETDFRFLNHFNGNNFTRMGAYAEYSGELLKNVTLRVKGLSQFSIDESGTRLNDLPLITGNARIFYTYQPGKSMLRVGVESGLLTDFTGDSFFPLTRSYYPGNYSSGLMMTGIDAFLEVRLGDAFVKIQFANLLSQNYYYVSVNPMYPMNLRLTANWTFSEN